MDQCFYRVLKQIVYHEKLIGKARETVRRIQRIQNKLRIYRKISQTLKKKNTRENKNQDNNIKIATLS